MTYPRSFAVASAAVILLAGTSGTAVAESMQIGTLSISDPWARATPPRAATAGGFVTIENSGEEADRLVGATSPIAGRVEIHEMRMDDGTMIMRAAKSGVEIPAGGKATLAPGGLHIMFMELNEGLIEGNAIRVMLNFENAGDVEVLFPVEAIGARGPGGGHGHGTEMHGADMHGDHGHGDDPEGPRMNGHGQ